MLKSRHSGVGRNPCVENPWIPAYAGMTGIRNDGERGTGMTEAEPRPCRSPVTAPQNQESPRPQPADIALFGFYHTMMLSITNRFRASVHPEIKLH